MHETHQDTWNLSKRKPQQYRGTLGKKYAHLFAGGIIIAYTAFCHFYNEYGMKEERKERLIASTTERALDAEKRIILSDPFYGSAIRNIQNRRDEQGLSFDPDAIINNREKKINF